jgi:hypothetical protein
LEEAFPVLNKLTYLERNLVDILLNLGIGELSSDKTFSSEKSVLRVDNGLTLGWLTDELLKNKEREKTVSMLDPCRNLSVQVA